MSVVERPAPGEASVGVVVVGVVVVGVVVVGVVVVGVVDVGVVDVGVVVDAGADTDTSRQPWPTHLAVRGIASCGISSATRLHDSLLPWLVHDVARTVRPVTSVTAYLSV